MSKENKNSNDNNSLEQNPTQDIILLTEAENSNDNNSLGQNPTSDLKIFVPSGGNITINGNCEIGLLKFLGSNGMISGNNIQVDEIEANNMEIKASDFGGITQIEYKSGTIKISGDHPNSISVMGDNDDYSSDNV